MINFNALMITGAPKATGSKASASATPLAPFARSTQAAVGTTATQAGSPAMPAPSTITNKRSEWNKQITAGYVPRVPARHLATLWRQPKVNGVRISTPEPRPATAFPTARASQTVPRRSAPAATTATAAKTATTLPAQFKPDVKGLIARFEAMVPAASRSCTAARKAPAEHLAQPLPDLPMSRVMIQDKAPTYDINVRELAARMSAALATAPRPLQQAPAVDEATSPGFPEAEPEKPLRQRIDVTFAPGVKRFDFTGSKDFPVISIGCGVA